MNWRRQAVAAAGLAAALVLLSRNDNNATPTSSPNPPPGGPAMPMLPSPKLAAKRYTPAPIRQTPDAGQRPASKGGATADGVGSRAGITESIIRTGGVRASPRQGWPPPLWCCWAATTITPRQRHPRIRCRPPGDANVVQSQISGKTPSPGVDPANPRRQATRAAQPRTPDAAAPG